MSGLLAVMILVMLVLLIQLWLLNVAIEAYLASRPGLAIPTFSASLLCFALSLTGLRYVYLIDKHE